MIKMDFLIWKPVYQRIRLFIIDIIVYVYTAVFDTCQSLFCDVVSSIINKFNKTTCVLDPFPTKLLISHLSSINNNIIIIYIFKVQYLMYINIRVQWTIHNMGCII